MSISNGLEAQCDDDLEIEGILDLFDTEDDPKGSAIIGRRLRELAELRAKAAKWDRVVDVWSRLGPTELVDTVRCLTDERPWVAQVQNTQGSSNITIEKISVNIVGDNVSAAAKGLGRGRQGVTTMPAEIKPRPVTLEDLQLGRDEMRRLLCDVDASCGEVGTHEAVECRFAQYEAELAELQAKAAKWDALPKRPDSTDPTADPVYLIEQAEYVWCTEHDLYDMDEDGERALDAEGREIDNERAVEMGIAFKAWRTYSVAFTREQADAFCKAKTHWGEMRSYSVPAHRDLKTVVMSLEVPNDR